MYLIFLCFLALRRGNSIVKEQLTEWLCICMDNWDDTTHMWPLEQGSFLEGGFSWTGEWWGYQCRSYMKTVHVLNVQPDCFRRGVKQAVYIIRANNSSILDQRQCMIQKAWFLILYFLLQRAQGRSTPWPPLQVSSHSRVPRVGAPLPPLQVSSHSRVGAPPPHHYRFHPTPRCPE